MTTTYTRTSEYIKQLQRLMRTEPDAKQKLLTAGLSQARWDIYEKFLHFTPQQLAKVDEVCPYLKDVTEDRCPSLISYATNVDIVTDSPSIS